MICKMKRLGYLAGVKGNANAIRPRLIDYELKLLGRGRKHQSDQGLPFNPRLIDWQFPYSTPGARGTKIGTIACSSFLGVCTHLNVFARVCACVVQKIPDEVVIPVLAFVGRLALILVVACPILNPACAL